MPPALAGGFFTTEQLIVISISIKLGGNLILEVNKIQEACMGFITFCMIIWVVSLTCNIFSDISVSISIMNFPGGSVVTNLPDDTGDAKDAGSVPGLGRSSGVGNGNPLQYLCWENPRDRVLPDRGVHGLTNGWT